MRQLPLTLIVAGVLSGCSTGAPASPTEDEHVLAKSWSGPNANSGDLYDNLPKKIREVFVRQDVEMLLNVGLTIHTGNTPPNIEGAYRINSGVNSDAWTNDEPVLGSICPIGKPLGYEADLVFADPSSELPSELYKVVGGQRESLPIQDAKYTIVSGSGKDFTAFSITLDSEDAHFSWPDGTDPNLRLVEATVYSGQLTDGGILELQRVTQSHQYKKVEGGVDEEQISVSCALVEEDGVAERVDP